MKRRYSDEEINSMYESAAYEMATIGKIQVTKNNKPRGRLLKVFITSDTQPQFHVHIWDVPTKGKELNVCIKLDKPEYFAHDRAVDRFSKEELEAFIEFMKSPYTGAIRYNNSQIRTNWDYTILQWNLENPDNLMNISEKDGYLVTPEMPDYRLLNSIRIKT